MPTTLTNGIQLPDKGSVDWYSSMQSNYNLIDTHLGDTDVHVTAEDKANWNSKQGSLSQAQLDAIAQVATNTSDIATLQSGKANASHTHSSSDITDIDDYATKQYVDNSISGLVDNAPDALNTLNELSAALNDDSNFASTVTTALSAKANSADLATVATSGSYTDLTDKPTIPTNTSDLTNDSDFVVSSNLATIATSGDYDDLSNKPSIPTKTSDLNNDSGFVTLNDFDIPAKTSDLTNDSGFITSSDVPTSTSDLINDSNFVDTSNSAVSSGITSAKVTDYDTHVADTDIHVTTADKNKWNNQTYVFRYSSTTLVASSTNSNSLLDNTDNLKVGDKVIDSSGVIYSVTAIDTANSTFTIGTSLIDLAQDSDVVHKSGNETVGGVKTFNSNTLIYNSDNTATTPNLYLRSSKIELSSQGNTSGDQNLTFLDKNNTDYAYIKGAIQSNGSAVKIRAVAKDSSNNLVINELQMLAYTNGNKAIFPLYSNEIDLGVSNYKWKSVYATNYYYGSNNVEFSTKFVTTDTAQTISGAKIFSEDVVIGNSDTTQNSKRLVITSSKVNLGDNNSDSWGISFNAGSSYSALINSKKSTSSTQDLQFTVRTKDTNNALITADYRLRVYTDGKATIEPTVTDYISLGSSANRWKDVQTNQINGLTPSSLSMPATTGTVDISGYITDLTGNAVNTYSPVVNGYIVITCNSTDVDYIKISNNLDFVSVVDNTNNQFTSGLLGVWQPCVAGIGVQIRIKASALNSARFIPCQGNV